MHKHDLQTQQLLAEELTSEEVQELLQRLNVRDMGGSEQATVGSVVEATGSDVASVGRLLAEIRKEDFEERFGIRLDQHARRIETLEEKAQRLEKVSSDLEKNAEPDSWKHRSFQPSTDSYQHSYFEQRAKQEREGPYKVFAWILTGIVTLVFIVKVGCAAPNSVQDSMPTTTQVGVGTTDGTVYMDRNGSTWVELSKGGRRDATSHERARIRAIAAKSGM